MTVGTDVTVSLDDGVAVLCLDGAERMNAIGSHTCRALATAVADVENNGQTRAELGEGIAREREVATELFAAPDGQEGFAAFRERRAPAFAAGQPS
jgi:enoyl-CoA hydratase/carnithine racemase